jgi:hypothetical protein
MEYNPPKKKSHMTIISNITNMTIFKIPCPAFNSAPFSIPFHLSDKYIISIILFCDTLFDTFS